MHHEYDKDRKLPPASEEDAATVDDHTPAPGQVSHSSFLRRPEHPIPATLVRRNPEDEANRDALTAPTVDKGASGDHPDPDRRPAQGRRRGREVVVIPIPVDIAPGKISLSSLMRRPENAEDARGGRDYVLRWLPEVAPGQVSLSSFMRRPKNPIPSWFSGEAAVKAYQERQRQASSVRAEEQALGELLAATLASVAREAAEAEAARSPGRSVDAQKPETGDAQRAEPSAPVRLPSAVQARMERAYDRRFDDVELHPGSAEAAGQQAFTRGHHIHLESGVDPTSSHGEKVLAHELAHVAQQDGSGGRAGSRHELEREAARAATLAMQGQTARIALRAEAATAYAFSEDHDHEQEDDERARTKLEDAHHAGGDTHESAKHEGNAATSEPASHGEPGG